MIKKSILTLFIALTLGALSSSAATKYEINVAGVEVTSDNKGNVTGGDIKSGTVTYNSSTNVLTLSNVTISRTGGSNYGVHNRKCDNLTIRFVGTCKIESNEANAIHLDRASTVVVTAGSTLTASMTACNNTNRGVVYVNGVTANFEGSGTLNISGSAKDGTNHRPAGFEGTGKSSNSRVNVSDIYLTIITPGESFYKFGTVAFSSGVGVDVKCFPAYGSRAVTQTGNLNFNDGVACVTPADAVFSNGQYTENNDYWHFTDNYGVIISTANFPDDNFRTYMRSFCSSEEQYLTKSQLQNLTSLDVSKKSISHLTGVSRLTYLKTLNCEFNNLTWLPTLPASLTTLFCTQNELTALPALPASLTKMNCSSNQLTSLPALPSSLTTLYCGGNRISSLPALPASLTTLYCSSNRLSSLPSLPSSLTDLTCDENRITALPALPSSLTTLYCGDNKLTALPALPDGIEFISAVYNKIDEINVINKQNLKTLRVNDNKLNNLSVEGCNSLIELTIQNNQIKGSAMTSLINSMRTLPNGTKNTFYVFYNYSSEGNEITDSQVRVAIAKNWKPMKYDDATWVEIEVDDDVPGDVNGDGIVNGSDVTALYNYLLNNQATTGNADVNGDGNINGSDVTALYNLLLK